MKDVIKMADSENLSLHSPRDTLNKQPYLSASACCCCCCWVASVVSDSVRPHRQQPTRLPHPWDSPGKNTRVGCHFLLQCMKVKSESEVAQSCPTLSDPIDCSPPGSSIHGIFQARVLEWGAIAFSGSPLYTSIFFFLSPTSIFLISQWIFIFSSNTQGVYQCTS